VGGREPVEGDGAPSEMETVSDYARGDARGGGRGVHAANGAENSSRGEQCSRGHEEQAQKPQQMEQTKGYRATDSRAAVSTRALVQDSSRPSRREQQDKRTQPRTKSIGRYVSHTVTLFMPATRLPSPTAPAPSPPWAPTAPTKRAAAGANTKDASIQKHPRASPSSLPPPYTTTTVARVPGRGCQNTNTPSPERPDRRARSTPRTLLGEVAPNGGTLPAMVKTVDKDR